MSFKIFEATRGQKYPKLAISGPSGAGKTATALLILKGMGARWDEIAVIDTEHKSSSLYANSKPFGISEQIGQFKIIPFDPPNTIERYIEAISYAKSIGIKFLIIDSLSHSWNGEGGALDKVSEVSSKGGNSYAAWKNVTPLFTRMINEILEYPGAVIATMRSKQEYSQEVDPISGKKSIKKLGMGPIIRDGIEYEFDTVFDMDLSHIGYASKDRTGVFSNQQLIMNTEIGKMFEQWRMNGAQVSPNYQIQQAVPPVNVGPALGIQTGIVQPGSPLHQYVPPAMPQQPIQHPQVAQQMPTQPQQQVAQGQITVTADNSPERQEWSIKVMGLINQYELKTVAQDLCSKSLSIANPQFRSLDAKQLQTFYNYLENYVKQININTSGIPPVNF